MEDRSAGSAVALLIDQRSGFSLCLNGQVQQPPVPGDRDVIEAQALRRRQVLGAFLQGQETRREAWTGVPMRGVLFGVAIAIVVAVVIGIVALIGATKK